MLNTEFIIYGAIFIGVLVLVEGVYLVAFGKSISLNSRVNRRLQMLDKGARRDEVLAKLRKEMDQHMESRGIPLYSMLADRAQKAAIAFTPNQLIMLMGAVSVAAFLGLSIGTEAGLAIRLAMGIGFGVGGVFFWVNSKAKKRLAMIEEQLPDAVELMVRSLRVGHPFSSAISIQGNPRSAGDRVRRHRRRIGLWPRYRRGAQAHGRTARYAGFALPRGRGDDPAAIGW